jgi:ABC-2 type transport system ATP-binding protein
VAAAKAEILLRATDLSRRYGALLALDCLDLVVRAGECVAIMGANGSGKTTAAELICGMLEPTGGGVEVCGHSVHHEPGAIEARRALAYVPDNPRLYDDLTVGDHLRFVAAVHGVAEEQSKDVREDLLKRLNLAHRVDFFPRQLSRGMRQKTAVACAFVRPFRVAVLDEPIVGLDAASMETLRDLLLDSLKQKRAILLMTHSEAFATSVASRILYMEEGQLFDS